MVGTDGTPEGYIDGTEEFFKFVTEYKPIILLIFFIFIASFLQKIIIF